MQCLRTGYDERRSDAGGVWKEANAGALREELVLEYVGSLGPTRAGPCEWSCVCGLDTTRGVATLDGVSKEANAGAWRDELALECVGSFGTTRAGPLDWCSVCELDTTIGEQADGPALDSEASVLARCRKRKQALQKGISK